MRSIVLLSIVQSDGIAVEAKIVFLKPDLVRAEGEVGESHHPLHPASPCCFRARLRSD